MGSADTPVVCVALDEARALVDRELEACAIAVQAEIPGRLGEALGYALRSPGKRVRPALLLAAYHAAGGNSPAAVGLATAVEIVHTYSLVHDDLPCMDDDDMRRGRATVHKVYGSRTAILAGVAMISLAALVVRD